MKAGFVCASACCLNDKGQLMVQSHEHLSLLQWTPLFEKVVIYWTETKYKKDDKWCLLEAPNVTFEPICHNNDSLLEKIRKIKEKAKCTNCNVFYYRMPSYETLLFYQFQDKRIPYFVEMHGNQESVIMLGSKPFFVKKILNYFVHRKNQALCSNAKFAISIGPKLVEDYIKTKIPVLVTTNHLTREADYPQDVPYHSLHHPIKILFVGSISERKGLGILFQALKKLNEEGIEFEMLLAGEGPIKEKLSDYAKANKFMHKVHFLGQVRHGVELYNIYKGADIFVLPSVAAEGVPRVTHEAMIFGCAIVATNIGSVSWQLNNNSGIVIQPNDVIALYESLKKLIYNEDLRKTIVKCAYTKSKNYSWEKQCSGIRVFVKKHLNNDK